MSEERMILRSQYAVERLTVEVHDKDNFMEEASVKLARALLENGCLVHQSEYDIRTGYTHEVVHVLAAQRERRLP